MGALELGRQAYERRAWAAAFDQLTSAEELDAGQLEMLAVAAHCLGRNAESVDAWSRCYSAHLKGGDADSAAWAAAWCGFGLLTRGEFSLGSGWLGRAQELCEQQRLDGAVVGFIMCQGAAGMMLSGDPTSALPVFQESLRIAQQFDDRHASTLGRLGLAQCNAMLGRPTESAQLLDQVMVAVAEDAVSPLIVGLAFCAAVEACQSMLDVRRAQDWTIAFTKWCDGQPDLVPYRGNCLVHRAEILTLHGAWPEAYLEAERARDWLSQSVGSEALGRAYYSLGELHRLRGELTEAESAFKLAGQHGSETQPGLGLLRLTQGHPESADTAITRALAETRGPTARAALLAARVEIALTTGDVAAARKAAEELDAIAEQVDVPLLRAQATSSRGAVTLADGDASGSLALLRTAWRAWQELDAPYQAARVRVLIGKACRLIGDADSADMELEAAAWVFQELGAAPDLAEVHKLSSTRPATRPGGLSMREVQVLRLVAAGQSNRGIAEELFLSEKTVHRHVSNIFTKIDVSSRAAATAWAFQHDLV